MGVPDSQVFLPDKDLNDMERLNVLVTSSSLGDHEQRRPDGKEKRRRASPPLMIKIPSYHQEKDEDRENEGFKTPTSTIHRISEILQCPPAPRKPKPLPSLKRRAPRQVLLLDLSREIDSLFPRPIVFDLGGKMKRVKTSM